MAASCEAVVKPLILSKGSVVDRVWDPSQGSLCHYRVASAVGKEVKGGAGL